MNTYVAALENGLFYLLNGVVLYFIYLISRICVVSFRAKENDQASPKEKIKGYLVCLFIVALLSVGIAYMVSKENDVDYALALKLFEIGSVASLIGVYYGFKDDRKLTSKQRTSNFAQSLKKDSYVDQEY